MREVDKNMTTRLAACAAIVIGAALTLRAAEVTEAVAKEAVAGWASLQEALTANRPVSVFPVVYVALRILI